MNILIFLSPIFLSWLIGIYFSVNDTKSPPLYWALGAIGAIFSFALADILGIYE